MFERADKLLKSIDPHSAEKLAEVLLEIGRDFAQKEDFKTAAKWLLRAYTILDLHNLENLSRNGVDLRLIILQHVVNALLKTDEPDDKQKAMEMISFLESEMGDMAVVLMLRVQLLDSSPPDEFDEEAYAQILFRVVACFNFSDTHFKWIMHHVKKLHERNKKLASRILDEFLVSKIITGNKVEWLERAVVLRVWMTTQSADPEDLSGIDELLTEVHQTIDSSLQPVAAVAAQSVSRCRW
jgi:hypothetical protein